MDSRQETRFETDQEVTVTLLGDSQISFSGRIANVSGKGMCLNCGRALPPGGAIQIEMADTLMLGEVVYCRPLDGSFQIGLSLEQALYHTAELAALLDRLLGQKPTKAAAVT